MKILFIMNDIMNQKMTYYDKLTYYVPKHSYEHKKKVQNIFSSNYFFGVILNNTINNHL
jgi:hypothetical protein